MAALEILDLTKDYLGGFWLKRPFRALDHLTLSVQEGEIFGLLGPNGAGKTTTLKLLLRLIYPTEGTARLLGQPLGTIDVHRRLGYLPEAPYFYDYLTAHEFLDYCGRLFGYDPAERRRRVASLLERVGLARAGDIALRNFSRGMLQRVGIAQALINDPELLFLDEPTLGLDPVGRREVHDLIVELRARGTTVCFSTHILADVESLCDRIAILNRGRLHGLGIAQPSPALLEALKTLGDSPRLMGDRLTLHVPDDKLYAVLDCVRQQGGRLVAVNPLRASLEDYFYEEFGTEQMLEVTDKV